MSKSVCKNVLTFDLVKKISRQNAGKRKLNLRSVLILMLSNIVASHINQSVNNLFCSRFKSFLFTWSMFCLTPLSLTHTHTHTYTHIYTHTHTYTHIHTHAHTCTHMHTHTYTPPYKHITYIHIHRHTYTHISLQLYTDIDTHRHTSSENIDT